MRFKQRCLQLFIVGILFTGIFFIGNVQVQAAENVTLGSKGQQVQKLQQALNIKDYWCGEASGLFGPRTYNALIRFQKDHKLAVDGKIDAASKKALDMLPAPPAQPDPLIVKKVKQVKAEAVTAKTTEAVTRTTEPNVSRGSRTMYMVASGYTAAAAENWPYAGAPSYIGLPLARGIVAVDPNVIPMGSKLYIEGYGTAIAADQGGAINGNRIDLFFDSKYEALNWGLKTVKVTVW